MRHNGKVMILGGYGNFGSRIARTLAAAGVFIIIAGRNRQKAEELAEELDEKFSEPACFNINTEFSTQLKKYKPAVVIHAVGPFQTSDYSIAETCIKHGVHYIDLADGRDFVTGIASLDEKAKANHVTAISGASTVPGLSSAVLERYKDEFSEIDSLIYGISPGQKATRGLATTQGILTYIGKPMKPAYGSTYVRYGWQGIYSQKYPDLGRRWMGNCDIPDLDLLPKRYSIKSIRFSAGMESALLHFGIWSTSWLVRLGLPLNLPKHADFLLHISHWFDWLGTGNGGMHMLIRGKDKNGQPHEVRWFIIAKNGDGPHIPTIPAILLAKKLANKEKLSYGAMPCVAMISLEEYMAALERYNVRQFVL